LAYESLNKSYWFPSSVSKENISNLSESSYSQLDAAKPTVILPSTLGKELASLDGKFLAEKAIGFSLNLGNWQVI
jgi:hypothetical protein